MKTNFAAVSLLLLLVSACNDDNGDTGGTAGSAGVGAAGGTGGSACAEPVYQLAQADLVNSAAPVPATVCLQGNRVRPHSGVNVSGGDFCPSVTQYSDGFTPECGSNADCSAGSVCLCPMGFGEGILTTNVLFPAACVPADCSGPADCGGLECGLNFDEYGAAEGLRCHTPDDECQSALDCKDAQVCLVEGGRWVCASPAVG